MLKFVFILCILGAVYPAQICAQTKPYLFRTMSPEGGLYYDGIVSIKQDGDGFIWAMMENNLYRFDGYEYKSYYNSITNLQPSVEWLLHNIVVNAEGKLFVNTSNGLLVYDKSSDNFRIISAETPAVIFFDSFNNLWMHQNEVWNIYDLQTKTFFTPKFDGQNPATYVNRMYCLSNGDLYVFSGSRNIYRYNWSKREFSLCMSLPEDDRIERASISKGKLWLLLRRKGLYRIDLTTFNTEDFFDFYAQYPEARVRTMLANKKGEVWLGAIEGLYILSPDTRTFTKYVHSKTESFSLPNNSIWKLDEDNQQNIWIGMYAGNICYVNPDETAPFSSVFPKEDGLNCTPVSAFAENGQYLYVGTEGGGVNLIDRHSGKYSYFTHTDNSNGLSYNNIKTILVDKSQNLWIATWSGGLNFYDSATGKFTHFLKMDDKNSLLYESIRKIVAERDSGIWITYQQKTVEFSYYSFNTKSFIHYDLKDKNYIFDIIRKNDHQLLILCCDKVYVFDTMNNKVEKIIRDDKMFMNFTTFCFDYSGNLWLGTIGNGLVRYNSDNETLSVYNGLLDYGISAINSICTDDDGNIWMGTDNGLVRYEIRQNTFSHYDSQDGLQGHVFYPLAVMKSSDGTLYFGGTNGFTKVEPRKISRNTFKPKIIISDFLINNISAHNLLPDNHGSEITLNHNQNNFSFLLSSDNYLIPEKNRFQYRLRGYDTDWTETDASQRVATYSKVPAGTYYFEVIATNNDGVQSDLVTIARIRCKPAFWFSLPAFLLYFVAVAAVIMLIIRYLNDKKKLRMQLYLENIEKHKKEEIHKAQMQFYTDISHDFKTPLSLILAALYNMKMEGINSDYYELMNNNSKRLLNLVNQLMDFKTVENGKMKLRLKAVDINALVQKTISDFKEYAQKRNISLNIKTSTTDIFAYIDESIFEKIILNLVNNALKYTSEGGAVTVEVLPPEMQFKPQFVAHYSFGKSLQHSFAVIIRDTGTGIPEKMLETVFERYYKVTTDESGLAQSGTGIGLALVKSLILLHHGYLKIFSEHGAGTDIVIRFSTDESVYAPNDFVHNEVADFEENRSQSQDDFLNDSDLKDNLKNVKQRILLVEDHDDLRRLIADALSEDYEVIEAANGQIASELLNDRVIDLIISDVIMPVKDGITFCRETKANIETSHIPFVMLTAKSGQDSHIEGAESGADVYLEKPVDFNLLKLTVSNVFRQQQRLREYYAGNYFAEDAELSVNERDNKFLTDFIQIIDDNLTTSELDVNYIATQLSMSRSKLYNKIKTMTGKSIIDFILNRRLRRAARLMIEGAHTIRQVMDEIGIESQAYFTNAFKKEYGDTPTAFVAKYRKKNGGN